VCDREPAVAVMVTEEVCVLDELDPPQPEIPPNPAASPAMSAISDVRSSHLRRLPNPKDPAKSQPAMPTPASEIAMPPPVPGRSFRLAVCEVAKVIVVVAAVAPFGVTVLGLKLQE
jgi:hypothetical protein